MADYAIHDTTLIAQANILRKKFGTSDRQDPADYASKMNLMGLLEEKTQASSSVCAFSDGADDVPVKNVIATIAPTLTGVSSVNVTQTDGNEPPTVSETYAAQLGRTVYGGTADLVTGEGQETYGYIVFDGSDDETWYPYTNYEGYSINIATMKNGVRQDGVCNQLTNSSSTAQGQTNAFWLGVNTRRFYVLGVYQSMGSTLEAFKAFLSENPLILVYPLDTTTDFAFTGQEIHTRLGYNAFWSDEGDTEVTYRGQGTLTPVLPTLISKSITENGTYSAEDDNADGYDEVIVNVSGGGGGSCERLFYARCYDNYQVEIPTISSLVQGTNYSSYVSYSTSTKKFTALQDFTAVIIGWVYTYQTYEASYSQGAFVVNNKRLATYTATGKTQGSTGGAYMVYNFKQGDEFYPYTPSTDGYPRQNCKVYKVGDVPDDVYTFADEEA